VKSPDVLPVDFTVGDDEGQSPAAGQGRVGWEANTSESEEKNLADAMSTGLHTKSLQHDIDILAEESGEGTAAFILYPQIVTDLEDNLLNIRVHLC
jgi:hypothetical protein